MSATQKNKGSSYSCLVTLRGVCVVIILMMVGHHVSMVSV